MLRTDTFILHTNWTNSTNSNSYLQLILAVLPAPPAKGHMGWASKQSQATVLSGNHQEQVVMNRIFKHKNSIHKQQKALLAMLPHCQVGFYYFSTEAVFVHYLWEPLQTLCSPNQLFPALSTHTTRSCAYQNCHIPASNQAYSNRACSAVQTCSLTHCAWKWAQTSNNFHLNLNILYFQSIQE